MFTSILFSTIFSATSFTLKILKQDYLESRGNINWKSRVNWVQNSESKHVFVNLIAACLIALVYVDRFMKLLRFSMSTFALFLSSSCVSCFSMSTSTGLRFHAFLLMSTGLALVYVDRFKVLRFSMSIFALFPVYMSMFFYVVIFNLMYIFWLAKRYSILITHFTRIINRAWTLWIYKYIIISGRYTAIKQWNYI